jgi:uncharacterized membrane protein
MQEETRMLRGVRSVASIGGHPLHPMLIPFPIAFLVGALATDVAFASTRDLFWARVSLWLLGAGVLTGLASAVLGLIDFVAIRRVRSTAAGWVHFLGNVAAVGVALANWLLRTGNHERHLLPLGITLSAVTTAMLIVTGWLGGELSYRHGIGVHPR